MNILLSEGNENVCKLYGEQKYAISGSQTARDRGQGVKGKFNHSSTDNYRLFKSVDMVRVKLERGQLKVSTLPMLVIILMWYYRSIIISCASSYIVVCSLFQCVYNQ